MDHEREVSLMRAGNAGMVEAMRAIEKHGGKVFNSSHEAYAVLLEEVDELWDAIKGNDLAHARVEAIQVCAMAIRFIAEIPTTKE